MSTQPRWEYTRRIIPGIPALEVDRANRPAVERVRITAHLAWCAQQGGWQAVEVVRQGEEAVATLRRRVGG